MLTIFMSKCKHIKQKIDRTLYCKMLNKKITFKECSGCEYKEYNAVKKQPVKKDKINKPIKGKKHKLTKATEIPKEVKLKVWERDKHRCIFCGKEVPWNLANSHYIKRSQLGLGIEQNVMTNCERCHALYDDSLYREEMKEKAKKHFINLYPDWDEKNLIYKKLV